MLPGSSTALPLPGGKSTGRSLERFSRRSACDRCRSYKLRCEREPGPEAALQPCRRCARAAVKCVSVGRLRPSLEKQSTVEARGSGNRQYATPCRILPAATKALPISQPSSYYNDTLESIPVDGVYQSDVSGDIELNFSNTLVDVTQEAFDFDFSIGVTEQSPDEDLINFDSQLPITHVVEPFQDETFAISPEPDPLKSDNRKNCLQNLANLHASLLQDLDEQNYCSSLTCENCACFGVIWTSFSHRFTRDLEDIYAEATFVCPSYWLASAFTGNGRTAYKYQYSVPFGGHTDDLTAIFGPADLNQSDDFVAAFRRVWGNFVTTSNPSITATLANGGSNAPNPITNFPVWTASSPQLINLNITGGVPYATVTKSGIPVTQFQEPGLTNSISVANAYTWEGGRGTRCDFWRSIASKIPI